MKIYLNKIAQEMLFGYLTGVDWQIDLCEIDPNDKSENPKYILLPEKEQNRIHDKVLDWIADYKKKYNGKYSEIDLDEEVNFYLNIDSENQISLIDSEVLDPANDVEDIFEDYWCYKTKRQKRRVKLGKENLFKEYKLAQKQLDKLSKVDEKI